MKKESSAKTPNIVEKVFGRPEKTNGPVSTIFTHTRQTAKVLPEQPAFTPTPAAIDFGSAGVKLLQLSKEPKGLMEISVLDEEPYRKVLERDPVPQQKEALQKLLSRNSIGPSVLISLSSRELQVFNFTFPPMSDKELDEAIFWKVKQARPFELDIDKVKFGIVPWSSRLSPTQLQQRVMVVCARLETVEKKVEMLGQLGLKTLAVEAAPVSQSNIKKSRNAVLSSEETTLWLDFGKEESTISVEKGGVTLFFRNLGITAGQLTAQLAQSLGVDETKAEALKRSHGLSFWSPEKESAAPPASAVKPEEAEAASVYRGIVSLLENLVIDIEHSFKYFSYQLTQSQISKFDKIILAGGGANLKNLDQFLSAKLGVPAVKLDPLSGYRIRDRLQAEKGALLFEAGGYAVALGLALGHLLPKATRLNLLSAHRRISVEGLWKEAQKNPKKAIAAAACVFLILSSPQLVRIGFHKMQLKQAEKKVKEARLELNRLQTEQLTAAEEEAKLVDKTRLLETKLQVIDASSRGDEKFSNILAKLASLLPEEVWITKLTYTGSKMALVGLTLKNELIVSFMERLSQSSDFKDVTFNYTQKEPNTKTYRFEVVMNVK